MEPIYNEGYATSEGERCCWHAYCPMERRADEALCGEHAEEYYLPEIPASYLQSEDDGSGVYVPVAKAPTNGKPALYGIKPSVSTSPSVSGFPEFPIPMPHLAVWFTTRKQTQ